RIDLLIREGDELTVIDWKSDAIGPDAVKQGAESHRGQGECYVAALERITGMPVREVVFVFARVRAEFALSDFPGPRIH
ncbi:MAG: PD-(D/E)XK nuclease family protein, partial [Thermoleophilia bacterium]